MIPEAFEYSPLANLMRGAAEDESRLERTELDRVLAARGLNTGELVAQIESRVSSFLQRQRSAEPAQTSRKWKHPSVQLFAAGENPISKMISLASELALKSMDAIAAVRRVDPFLLAEMKRIPVVPNESIADARLVPLGNNRLQIEFNPAQPKTRIRFSIAHELAHTFFPDCHEVVRNRLQQKHFGPNDWELEMICNVGAAELLMPIASFPELKSEGLNIDALMKLRETLEVSAEALLSRVARVTVESCSMFAASRLESGLMADRYRLDYAINSRSWPGADPFEELLPKKTILSACTAIGFTAKGDELWKGAGHIHLECVGVLPYRGARYPRVVGIIRPLTKEPQRGLRINYVRGDATQPRGSGPRIIAHVVNDKALSWGAGFARALGAKWPHSQEAFRRWAMTEKAALRLGNTFTTEVEKELWAFQLVCQHGYGPSSIPRIRYGALKACLDALVLFARKHNATVHMPRLGSGQGQAIWSIIAEMVDEILCRAGIPVTVYDLPNARPEAAPELPGLFKPSREAP